jgi:hypothetical protein
MTEPGPAFAGTVTRQRPWGDGAGGGAGAGANAGGGAAP